jgi:hypothetical protein
MLTSSACPCYCCKTHCIIGIIRVIKGYYIIKGNEVCTIKTGSRAEPQEAAGTTATRQRPAENQVYSDLGCSNC